MGWNNSQINSQTRGLWAGSNTPGPATNTINSIEFSSVGNVVDFANLSVARSQPSGACSSSRGIFAGGLSPSYNVIDSVEIGSFANAVDFGDLTTGEQHAGGMSSKVRGVFSGINPGTTSIEFITIATRANATDFGDCTSCGQGSGNANNHGGLQEFQPRAPELYSPTGKPLRSGAVGVGDLWMYARNGALEFGSVATLGNGVDFGDCSQGLLNCSSNTRGIHGKANVSSSFTEYVTYSTKGNAAFFGNATVNRQSCQGGSNLTRGMFPSHDRPACVRSPKSVEFPIVAIVI